jgi:hypothetical protein
MFSQLQLDTLMREKFHPASPLSKEHTAIESALVVKLAHELQMLATTIDKTYSDREAVVYHMTKLYESFVSLAYANSHEITVTELTDHLLKFPATTQNDIIDEAIVLRKKTSGKG